MRRKKRPTLVKIPGFFWAEGGFAAGFAGAPAGGVEAG
jgi:hypothetical protein